MLLYPSEEFKIILSLPEEEQLSHRLGSGSRLDYSHVRIFLFHLFLLFDNYKYAFARYWLISNERVRDYGCDSVRAAAEYFSKSCAPGVR